MGVVAQGTLRGRGTETGLGTTSTELVAGGGGCRNRKRKGKGEGGEEEGDTGIRVYAARDNEERSIPTKMNEKGDRGRE